MFNIGGFITEIQKKIDKPRLVRVNIIHIISQVIGYEFDDKDIGIRSSTIHIKTKPAIRQIVSLKKQHILDRIKNEVGISFTDIR